MLGRLTAFIENLFAIVISSYCTKSIYSILTFKCNSFTYHKIIVINWSQQGILECFYYIVYTIFQCRWKNKINVNWNMFDYSLYNKNFKFYFGNLNLINLFIIKFHGLEMERTFRFLRDFILILFILLNFIECEKNNSNAF